MSLFGKHGQFSVAASGNLMVNTSEGAWNLETALDFVKVASKVAKPLLGKPWGKLTVLDDWELATMDCIPVIRASVVNAVKGGMQAEAIVNTKGAVKLELFNATLPADVPLQRALFDNQDDALAWLKEQGFEAKENL